jgi:hypothetical protein
MSNPNPAAPIVAFEARKLVYDHCVELHRYFLTWRHQLLAGYLATLAGLGIAYSWTYSTTNNARRLGWVICGLGAFLTFIFWLLDYRNRDLYHACQQVASDIEEACGFNADPVSTRHKGLYARLNQTSLQPGPPSGFKLLRWVTHSRAIDILLLGAFAALIAGAIYSYRAVR